MLQQLNIQTDGQTPFLLHRTTLEGKDYDLDLAWNERRSLWTVTIRTQEKEILTASKILRHGHNLLARCLSPNKPPGVLFCWCLTPGNLSAPGVADLGVRAGIFYWPSSDIEV